MVPQTADVYQRQSEKQFDYLLKFKSVSIAILFFFTNVLKQVIEFSC